MARVEDVIGTRIGNCCWSDDSAEVHVVNHRAVEMTLCKKSTVDFPRSGNSDYALEQKKGERHICHDCIEAM